MTSDRVFKEEDAIWWDANVRGPRRYSLREMDEEYEGLSPFSINPVPDAPREPERIYIMDPEAAYRVSVDVNWMNIIALVIVMLTVVAVVAIFAAAAVFVIVPAVVILGIIVLVFAR